MRITIIGQAPFGAAIYKRLRADGHEIGAVFTPPDGQRPDPLAEAARADAVALVQPKRWQRKGEIDQAVFEQFTASQPDLNVMAFVTQIIPTSVLEHPPHTTIQFHPSLLPKHRGRSAINHALLAGDRETGVTVFWVDAGIDTGPILLQKRCPISENDTVNSLYREQLFPLGVEGLAEAVQLVAAGSARRTPQDESQASYEAPWEGDIARIDWSQPAAAVHNFIRGSDRQPGAWTTWNGARLRIYGSAKVSVESGPAGTIAAISADGLTVHCGDGSAVCVDTVRQQDGAPAPTQEWAAGAGIAPGAQLE